MIISNREKVMLVATLIFMLYATLAFSLRKKLDSISALRDQQREKRMLLQEYKNLISQNQLWKSQQEQNIGKMPTFEKGRQVETYWLGLLDRLAQKNGLSIVRRQAGEEKQSGEVFEMPIECKEWEGSLESLTAFLYDIHAEGAMLDVRKLFVRPATGSNAVGLRGSFTLYCAYLRADSGEQ